MSLSDKIFSEMEWSGNDSIAVKDVREFIKEFKEELCSVSEYKNFKGESCENPECEPCRIIDKRAGENLI